MVKITNIDTFLTILKRLDSNNSQYQLYGFTKEEPPTFSFSEKPTILNTAIVAMTPIGELFFQEMIQLEDESIVDFRKKLSTLNFSPADVEFSNGIITIN